MKVLGVTPTAKEVMWALVDGASASPNLIKTEVKKQKYPVGQEESIVLNGIFEFSKNLISSLEIEKICVLQAGTSQYGSASAIRIKVEAVFQLAGLQKNIPVLTIPPQTLRAREKKFLVITGDTPENIFTEGAEFTPKPWKDAVLTAWIGLV
jgi:hypothetical protein